MATDLMGPKLPLVAELPFYRHRSFVTPGLNLPEDS